MLISHYLPLPTWVLLTFYRTPTGITGRLPGVWLNLDVWEIIFIVGFGAHSDYSIYPVIIKLAQAFVFPLALYHRL